MDVRASLQVVLILEYHGRDASRLLDFLRGVRVESFLLGKDQVHQGNCLGHQFSLRTATV
jgi:hypothetical protein